MTQNLSLPGSWTYAYTGKNAYTGGQAYSGGHAYTLESYGFDGFPGNPMLASGIQAARADLRRSLFLVDPLGGTGDIGEERNWGPCGLPALADAAAIRWWGPQVRHSMGLLELMSSVSFEFARGDNDCAGTARLWASCTGAKGADMRATLVEMARPERAYFEGQLAAVDAWSATRDARLPEVLTQVAPPIAYFAAVMNLQAGRHRKTMEFIHMALQLAYACCMHFKHALACPRPGEYSAAIVQVLESPPHGAFPAGHATEAHLTAGLLSALAGMAPQSQPALALRRLAHRIAENRVVAGLHFPIDNVAGRLLGDALATYVLAAAGAPGAHGWTRTFFELPAGALPQDGAIEADSLAVDQMFTGAGCTHLPRQEPPPLAMPIVRQMWTDAHTEWWR